MSSLRFTPVALALGVFLAITFTLCVLWGLLFPDHAPAAALGSRVPMVHVAELGQLHRGCRGGLPLRDLCRSDLRPDLQLAGSEYWAADHRRRNAPCMTGSAQTGSGSCSASVLCGSCFGEGGWAVAWAVMGTIRIIPRMPPAGNSRQVLRVRGPILAGRRVSMEKRRTPRHHRPAATAAANRPPDPAPQSARAGAIAPAVLAEADSAGRTAFDGGCHGKERE